MISVIEAQKRDKAGKGVARKLRREGLVPGVFYSHGEEAMPLIFDNKLITQFLHGAHGLVELKVDGMKSSFNCVVKDVQFDPVTEDVLHVDLQGVKMDEKVTMTVPLVLKGTPAGIKAGGILEHLVRELEIECFPGNIPDHLEIEVAHLGIGDSIHIKDLSYENIEILDHPEEMVAQIVMPKKAAAEEAEEEEILGEETAEPELIRKERSESEEE